MSTRWFIRPATKEEQKFAYTCEEGDEVCKCIGHLRADFGRSGKEFWTTWWEHKNPELKTQDFRDALDDTINRLRDEEKDMSPLRNRSAMSKFCFDYREARTEDTVLESYVFRVDVQPVRYSFIMRMTPRLGVYNLYCYCYRTKDLETAVGKPDGTKTWKGES